MSLFPKRSCDLCGKNNKPLRATDLFKKTEYICNECKNTIQQEQELNLREVTQHLKNPPTPPPPIPPTEFVVEVYQINKSMGYVEKLTPINTSVGEIEFPPIQIGSAETVVPILVKVTMLNPTEEFDLDIGGTPYTVNTGTVEYYGYIDLLQGVHLVEITARRHTDPTQTKTVQLKIPVQTPVTTTLSNIYAEDWTTDTPLVMTPEFDSAVSTYEVAFIADTMYLQITPTDKRAVIEFILVTDTEEEILQGTYTVESGKSYAAIVNIPFPETGYSYKINVIDPIFHSSSHSYYINCVQESD